MALLAQKRRRACRGDRFPQRVMDRLRLALFRHDAEHPFGRAERRNGQGKGILRHGLESWEMSFAHLLLPAGWVEFHEFDLVRVVEIRHRWIVEAQVSILANAETA